jgi:hypothetical protein
MPFVVHPWLGLYQHSNEWPWLYIFLIFVQGFSCSITLAGASVSMR